ncbi:MAG: hypothetical protein V4498_02865 [candidate division FCPU426 bacterium]
MSSAEDRIAMLNIMLEGDKTRSTWEQSFLESIINQLEAGHTLSPAQEEKLLQIQRKE